MPMKLCIGDLLCSGETVANGSMSVTSDTVEKLTGRKPTHWKDAMLKYRDIFPKPEQEIHVAVLVESSSLAFILKRNSDRQ
ncbi:hypothetical protein PF008_g29745 [Phytophthora fragariae]|uniref:Uncharacterized protein n=2 Tax=Phytophthora fragariae TaxID=53985 RepID=A0A6G0Q7I1_9STRA|nr:hypothetical protein PF008_g29745 [Phytophthora fragariae]